MCEKECSSESSQNCLKFIFINKNGFVSCSSSAAQAQWVSHLSQFLSYYTRHDICFFPCSYKTATHVQIKSQKFFFTCAQIIILIYFFAHTFTPQLQKYFTYVQNISSKTIGLIFRVSAHSGKSSI